MTDITAPHTLHSEIFGGDARPPLLSDPVVLPGATNRVR